MPVVRGQGPHDELVGVGAGDGPRPVLVLGVVAVPEGRRLMAVGRVIDGMAVEGQGARRRVEGGDDLGTDDVASPREG
jgi:hypothetical protein